MAFRHALFVFFPQGVSSNRAHLGGYGIPAIPTPPSANPPTEFTEFTEISGVEEPPTDFADAHRWLGCVGFSHGIHGTHRSFWRRRASHRFHRCTQMVRLRRVLPRNSRNSQKFLAENILRQKLLWFLWLLWDDSLVSAWVWQGCHTLLICAHLCNLWENILCHKLLWVLWVLWEDSLVGAWVWQDAIPSYSLLC